MLILYEKNKMIKSEKDSEKKKVRASMTALKSAHEAQLRTLLGIGWAIGRQALQGSSEPLGMKYTEQAEAEVGKMSSVTRQRCQFLPEPLRASKKCPMRRERVLALLLAQFELEFWTQHW